MHRGWIRNSIQRNNFELHCSVVRETNFLDSNLKLILLISSIALRLIIYLAVHRYVGNINTSYNPMNTKTLFTTWTLGTLQP